MNLLVEPVALAAEDAVPVLHAQRDAHQAVMLGDGQVDDLVGFKKRREDGPALEHHAAEIDLAIKLGVGQDDLGALSAGGGLDAGALEAAARLVATDVSDNDAFGPGLPALADDFSDDFRVGVGGLLRGAVPGDVGLEDDDVLPADEAADSAEVGEGTLDKGAGFASLDHGQVGQLDAGCALTGDDAVVAAGLLRLGGDGAEAVPAEPNGGLLRRQRLRHRREGAGAWLHGG